MGSVHAGQGHFEEARGALAAGEALLRAVNDFAGLTHVPCKRVECERLAGDLPAARGHLADAESLVQELAAGPESEVAKEIAKLRAALEGSPDPPGE